MAHSSGEIKGSLIRIPFIKLRAAWRKTRKVHWTTWVCDSKKPWHCLKAKEAGQGRIAAAKREPRGRLGEAYTGRCGFQQRNGATSNLGPTGRKPGNKYMPGPFFLPVGLSLLLSPICQTQSEARVQALYGPDILPYELHGAWGRVEVRLRSGMAWWRMSWPYCQPLFIINFHLHLGEGEKSDRIQEMILCEGDRSLEYVLREVIHIFFFLSWMVFQI